MNRVPTGKRKAPEGVEAVAAEPSKMARHDGKVAKGGKTKDTALTETQTLGGLEISIPGMIVLTSKPGGGKSHMLRYIMYLYRKRFAHGIAFSKSTFRTTNLDYIPAFPGEEGWLNFKHTHYSPEILQAFLDGQAADPDKLGFLIIDDDISDPDMWYSQPMIDAATMYRQYNLFVVICTQHCNRVSTTIRECASQVGLFAMDTHNSIHACWESYGQEFRNDKLFYQWFMGVMGDVKNHNCAWKNKIDGKPYVIVRAPQTIPDFRIEYGNLKAMKRVLKKRRKAVQKKVSNEMLANLGGIVNRARSMKSTVDPYM